MQRAWAILSSVTCPALNIFLHHLINARFSRKKFLNIKCVFWFFSTTFVQNTSHSTKNCARYDKQCILVFMCSAHYSCQILMRLEFCWQISEKLKNIKFHENPSSGRRGVTRGRSGGHKEGRVQLKCDGTRWRTGGKVKGKLAKGVGNQYSSHYLGTWFFQHYYRWCAHLGCQ